MNAELPDNLHMPNWDQLTEGLKLDLETDSIEPLSVAAEYEGEYGRNQLIERIRELIPVYDARPGNVHKILARITSFDIIYTTNYDFLIEDAFREANQNTVEEMKKRPYRILVGEKRLAFYAGYTTANIIKMHGDLANEEYLILTQEDYDNYMSKYAMIATHLASTLITRTGLFLGYSLRDPNLLQIKNIVKGRLGELEKRSYIVTFNSSETEIQQYKENNFLL